MKRHESTEDYLETILILREKLGTVRAIDIATDMKFTKASVSVAMKNLREKGCIAINTDGHITLTQDGDKIAKSVYERHLILTKALLAIGVSEENAKKDACRIEHDLSDETFDKIKKHMQKNKYLC